MVVDMLFANALIIHEQNTKESAIQHRIGTCLRAR